MRGGTTDEKRVKELTETLYAKLEAYELILSKRNYLAGDVSFKFWFTSAGIANLIIRPSPSPTYTTFLTEL